MTLKPEFFAFSALAAASFFAGYAFMGVSLLGGLLWLICASAAGCAALDSLRKY